MSDLYIYVTTFVDAVALIMALVLLVSLIQRKAHVDLTGTVLMGGLFSLAVLHTMADPIMLERGQYDMRSLFIGAAAALLGPVVGAMALATGVIYRFYIGGLGVTVGVTGMVIAFAGGLVWHFMIKGRPWSFWTKSLFLGALIGLHVFSLLAASPDRWASLFTSIGPYMVGSSLLGAFLLNYLILGELTFLSEAKARQLEATTDHLTGLLNRRGLDISYPMCAAPDENALTGVSVLYFDIDKFKEVNDTYGHAVGDGVLRRVATRVASNLRPNDIFARLGGDEFVVVLRNVAAPEAKTIAERCRALVEKRQFVVDGLHLDLSVSIGAIWTLDQTEIERVLDKADNALYAAKKAGRNRVVFKSESFQQISSAQTAGA